MASGTIWGSATGSNGNRVNVWCEWWEDNIDYPNNRSLLHVRFYTQTKFDQSSTTYDNDGGPANLYVGGGLVSLINPIGINFRSASPHNRPLNYLGGWDGWVGRDGAGNASVALSGSFALSSSYISGGSFSGTAVLDTMWTGASAPSSPRFSASPFENSLTLIVNAGSGGYNNGIGYYRYYGSINGGATQHLGDGGTSLPFDTSGWGRGTTIAFYAHAMTAKGDNPASGWSGTAIKNRVPNTPTGLSVNKSVYVPGETVRVSFTNPGDPDGNIAGFEVARSGSETIVGTTASAGATYVDVPSTGWAAGSHSLRVRAYDAFGVRGAWSSYTSAQITSAPGAPSGVTATPATFESALRIAWTKGADGVGNPITGHEVRYSTSDDNATWGTETVVNVGAAATYYDIPAATLEALARAKYVQARVGSKSAYASTMYSSYRPTARKNRIPNTITTLSLDKLNFAPGESIKLNVTPAGDPDTNLSGIEVATNLSDTVIATASATATAVYIATTGWAPGTKVKLRARGYDALGVRGEWSAYTNELMLGVPLLVAMETEWKQAKEVLVAMETEWKPVMVLKASGVSAWKDAV